MANETLKSSKLNDRPFDITKISAVVVEDDFLVSMEISRTLEQIGCKLAGKAADGEEAVDIVCSIKPDIIFMDLKLPGIDGLEASRRIQQCCPTPIIVMTAFDSHELHDKAGEVGISAYLTKPPRASEIVRTIPIAVARHADLMEYKKLSAELEIELRKRKEAEASLKKSLKEKELLVRETHHRMKNNLAVIQSLLSLQSSEVEDDKIKGKFDESQNRVRAMAMIHEKLHNAKNLSSIDFSGYISDLVKYLYDNYQANIDRVKLELDISEIFIDVDTIIPCGLIINELISNALKHAFPGDRAGVLRVEVSKKEDDFFFMQVSDNGIGLPEDFDIRKAKSLGMKIINSLISQIKGVLELDTENGTVFKIKFKGKNIIPSAEDSEHENDEEAAINK